jgi:hypothetical protein
MKTKILAILTVSTLITLTACSTSTKREITEEAKKEPVTASHRNLTERLTDLINADTQITAEQKTALLSLVEKVSAENRELQLTINQKKSLLMKELLSPNYSRTRSKAMVSSIVSLDKKQLNNTLNALTEAKKILGKRENSEVLMERIMEAGGRD